MMASDLYSIRPAAISEQAALTSMIRAGRLNPFGLDWHRFLVAVSVSGEIRGCIQRKDHGGNVRELASLYVQPEWRGRGIASQLIRQLMQSTALPLWLTCRSRLASFYASFGFTIMDDPGEMPPYFRFVKRMFRVVRVFLPGKDGLVVMRCTVSFEPADS